jgi:hypothetical protein
MLFLFSIGVFVLSINEKHTLPIKYANRFITPLLEIIGQSIDLQLGIVNQVVD